MPPKLPEINQNDIKINKLALIEYCVRMVDGIPRNEGKKLNTIRSTTITI
jgi:hypothetical protein